MNNETFVPAEQINKRGVFTKTYSIGPGIYKAFSSSIPLHVISEGTLVPCDAQFKPDKESGSNILTSSGSRLTVRCAPSSNASFITISDSKELSLSWSLKDAATCVPEISEQKIPSTADPAERMFLEALYQAQGDLRYPEIFPDVALQCHMDEAFRDSFIFSEASSIRPLLFHIDTSLQPAEKDNHCIDLLDPDGETVFTLFPPALYDAKGLTGEVIVSFSITEKGFDLTYECDPDFIASAAFPVTLDPTVSNATSTSVVDTYVSSASVTTGS